MAIRGMFATAEKTPKQTPTSRHAPVPSPFAVTRVDGRSNVQVLLDYIADAEPGRTFTYDELGAALSVGSSHRYTPKMVQAIVNSAYARVLRTQDRVLHCVRGVGYRLALASEHRPLGLARTRRADVQLSKGLLTLQHVKLDEMTPAARQAHEGTLLVVGAMYQNQRAMETRLSKVEEAISRLTATVK